MFKIFEGSLSQSAAANPFDSHDQVNEKADGKGHRQFPLPPRLAEPA